MKLIDVKLVLFPTDFSEYSLHALKKAVEVAKENNAKLYLIHVIEEPQYWYVEGHIYYHQFAKEMGIEVSARIEKIKEEYCGNLDVETTILRGIPYYEIVKYASDKKIDLIIIGTHGRSGLEHILMGSTTEKVVRKSSCMVLVIKSIKNSA